MAAPVVAVVGGGQLARMMAAPAAALDVHLRVLVEDPGSSAAQVVVDAPVGAASDAAAIEELVENTHVDLGVMKALDETHSNLTIRQMPSSGNGMQLIVAPIARELAGLITVTRADGTLVWSGDSGESHAIDMAREPSGMYFVRGLGKSLVVQVVR